MEEWKIIEGYENYEVSSHGRVRNKSGLIIKQRYNGVYPMISLYNKIRKHYLIHRLVGIAFIPNPENKPQIDHIDNNPENNNISNLRWVTAHENTVRRKRNVEAKHIHWRENLKVYNIQYSSGCKKYQATRKTLEEAEAVLANWKTMYPHNII